MNHYNIVISTELLDDADYNTTLQTLCQGCGHMKHKTHGSSLSLGDDANHLITLIKPVQDLEEANEMTSRVDTLWSEISSQQSLENTHTHPVPISDEQLECPNEQLIQRLHQLADNIPKIGAFVDVYWLVKDENLPSIEENIELYGALKQLLEWNNAYYTFVTLTSDQEITNQSEPWVTMLRGHVTALNDLDVFSNPSVWRGSVHIVGSNIQKPIQIPGFELSDMIQKKSNPDLDLDEIITRISFPDDPVPDEVEMSVDSLPRLLSNKLEVIAQLDRQDIPILYYTGQHCKLCIQSESKLVDKSRHFIQRLEDNPRLCYLVKLCYGTSWRCPEDDSIYKDKTTREKKNWIDFVQENIDHVTTCPIQPELDGELGQHVLMLCASPVDDDTYRREFTCDAHLLRSPSSINGKVAHEMAVDLLWQMQNSDKGTREDQREFAERLLSDIPHFTASQFLHLQRCIKQAQVDALKTWIEKQSNRGESTDISTSELLAILQAAHSQVVHDARHYDMLYYQMPSLELEGEQSKVPRPMITELEKLVLAHHNETESKFARHRSNESLAGLSPPPRGKVVTLNAREFLKFFQNDGTATEECSTELSIKKSSMGKRLTKCTVDEVKTTNWPNSESLQFHDIYYNQGTMDTIEAKSKRLLSRFLTTETSSTCIYRQTHSPSILTIATELGQVKGQGEGQENKGRSPDRVTRSSGKRLSTEEAMKKESKRLYAAKKALAEQRQNAKVTDDTKVPSASDKTENSKLQDSKMAERISRAQRHKRKLEEIVKETLKDHGIQKDNPLFKPCALRLYNTTKSFVKDLTSSVGLRQAMTEIAQSNVKTVVAFESMNSKRHQKKK